MNKPLAHPLDSVFGISSDSSLDIEKDYAMAEVPPQQISPEEIKPDIKDEDDKLVEKNIDEVYDAAINAFTDLNAYTEVIEPRYAARNAEVAAAYLNIALQAANSRAKVKTDRKRANQFIPFNNGSKSTTNVLVASREEILRMISVDGEQKEL